MHKRELQQLVKLGEDSSRQFKADVTNPDSLAAELVAFSNSKGGTIIIGVADDGTLVGLSAQDVRRINQLIGNAATHAVRSPVSPRTENVSIGKQRTVVVVTVPEGLDKPYFDRQGVIWLKAGADKRRVQSKEELRRLFQDVDLLQADQVPTGAGIDELDRIRFRDFLSGTFHEIMPEDGEALTRLLENMNLAQSGQLNLAGLLVFGLRPQVRKPAFVVKAVRYPGTDVTGDRFLDHEDFEGPLSAMFEGALAFVLRNIPKVQGSGKSVNLPGQPIVPRTVFEELLVNALVHRDYFIQAPVRLFMLDDRVEIISPGNLPNHLTVQKIRAGNSVIRNPVLASFAAKGVLPYRGLGTGIRRAIADWPAVDLIDDREACTFTAIVRLQSPTTAPTTTGNAPLTQAGAPINAPLTDIQRNMLGLMAANPAISYDAMAAALGCDRTTIMRNVQSMKKAGVLRREGSKKSGRWVLGS
jgi:ATP-dependent DNA helicase RecG